MNRKSILCMSLLLFCLMALQQIQAQVPFIFTTDHTWSSYSKAGRVLSPLSFDVIFEGGTWAPAETSETKPDECGDPGDPPIVLPGPAIFSPGNAVCFRGWEDSAITSYFLKTFDLGSNSGQICHANITIRADNNFRLYVDETLVAGQNYTTCGLWDYIQLTGSTPVNLYTIDILPYLNTSATTHSILVEVGNCDYHTYLSAYVDISYELNCTPNPAINFSFAGNTLNVSGLGFLNGCYTHEDWNVYVKPSTGGSYTLLYAVQNSTRLGASRNITIPPGCNSYRILHRAKHTKCNGTIVQREALVGPITFCTPPGLAAAPQGITEDASGDVLTDFSENISIDKPFQATVNPVLPEVSIYPNPAHSTLTVQIPNADLAGEISLIDLQGRTVFEKQVTEQHLKIDCIAFPSGIYILQVVYPDKGMSVQKVQISH